MIRSILAVIVAVITWFIVATIGNWILRAALPGYSAVEVSMNFTFTMMICRLVLGLLSSLCAGFVCATVARNRVAPKVAGVVMVVLFLPVHYMLWVKFPLWYHLFFLISLAPALLIAHRFRARSFPRVDANVLLAAILRGLQLGQSKGGLSFAGEPPSDQVKREPEKLGI